MTEETAAVFGVLPFALIALATLLTLAACIVLDARGKL